jgi:hypothetical protein
LRRGDGFEDGDECSVGVQDERIGGNGGYRTAILRPADEAVAAVGVVSTVTDAPALYTPSPLTAPQPALLEESVNVYCGGAAESQQMLILALV